MTKKTLGLTLGELEAMRPCSLDERRELFGNRNRLTVQQALKAGATVSDILWVAGRLGLRDKIVAFAKRAADEAAHLKDNRAGRDAAAHSAAYAASAYAAAAASAAAHSAAYAASAAYAHSADAAAYAASADAASAAYADRRAAWNRARSEMIEKQKQWLIEIFVA